MQKLIIALLCSILITGCAAPEKAPRAENLFSIGGQTIEVSDELLATYRSKWVGNSLIPAAPPLKMTDIQWSLDLISIYESLQNPDCKQFQLTQARDFDPAVDTDKRHPDVISDMFDYVWEIDVCGKRRLYRVVHSQGSRDFAVYLMVP